LDNLKHACRVSQAGGVDPNRDTLSWGHDVEFFDRINFSHYVFNEIKIPSADFKSALKIGRTIREGVLVWFFLKKKFSPRIQHNF